jgi:hypothetical protein
MSTHGAAVWYSKPPVGLGTARPVRASNADGAWQVGQSVPTNTKPKPPPDPAASPGHVDSSSIARPGPQPALPRFRPPAATLPGSPVLQPPSPFPLSLRIRPLPCYDGITEFRLRTSHGRTVGGCGPDSLQQSLPPCLRPISPLSFGRSPICCGETKSSPSMGGSFCRLPSSAGSTACSSPPSRPCWPRRPSARRPRSIPSRSC